jgi:hypothetical protein
MFKYVFVFLLTFNLLCTLIGGFRIISHAIGTSFGIFARHHLNKPLLCFFNLAGVSTIHLCRLDLEIILILLYIVGRIK